MSAQGSIYAIPLQAKNNNNFKLISIQVQFRCKSQKQE